MKVKMVVIIGTNPLARALTKSLSLFLDVEHVKLSAFDDCSKLSITPYRKIVQSSRLVVIAESKTQLRLQNVIGWIHRLREQMKFSKEIVIYTSSMAGASELEETSLFFETDGEKPRYTLGSVKGHSVLGPDTPLGLFITKHRSPATIRHGTWTGMKAQGGALTKAEVILKHMGQREGNIQDKEGIQEVRELFLRPETRSLMYSIIPHSKDNKAILESLYNELETCDLETAADCSRFYKAAKTLLEVLPWKT